MLGLSLHVEIIRTFLDSLRLLIMKMVESALTVALNQDWKGRWYIDQNSQILKKDSQKVLSVLDALTLLYPGILESSRPWGRGVDLTTRNNF